MNHMHSFYDGVKNQASEDTRRGKRSPTEAKRHLPRQEYRRLCKASISKVNKRHPTEIHLALTLAWCLCARMDTTAAVHARHIDWEGDALLIGIAKSKRNYAAKATYFRVYANPYEPAVCPILALAIHLACYPHIISSSEIGSQEFGYPLFHSQGARGNLSDMFKELAAELHIEGVGTHSVRKGGITEACTGTPDFAPLIAAVIRARWTTKVCTFYSLVVLFEFLLLCLLFCSFFWLVYYRHSLYCSDMQSMDRLVML